MRHRQEALACAYRAAADEPRAAAWNALSSAERLRAASGLPAGDPLVRAVAGLIGGALK